jgi:hypothetical protein
VRCEVSMKARRHIMIDILINGDANPIETWCMPVGAVH